MKRRTFIQSLAGVPLFLSSSAWANPPSRLPMVGVIGCGRRLYQTIDAFWSRELRIVAASDCDRTRLAHAQKRIDAFYKAHPELNFKTPCRGYRDFRELLANPAIDAVFIATPEHWHATMSILAMRAGKDVYCEKPLTYSIAEAKALMRTERETGRILICGSQQRSMLEFQTAVDLVRHGVIGRISEVYCGFGGPSWPHRTWFNPANAAKEGRPNPDVDFDLWCGPAPLVPYSDELAPRGVHTRYPPFGKYDDWFGTGGVGDWGAHHLDIAQWALGQDAGGPIRACVSTAARSADPLLGRRRQVGAQLVFADGVRITHFTEKTGGWFVNGGLWFFGSDGVLFVNRGRFRLWTGAEVKAIPEIVSRFDDLAAGKGSIVQRGLVEAAVSGKTSFAARVLAARKQFLAGKADLIPYNRGGHVQNFLDAIATRKRLITDAAIGGRSSILCQLVNATYLHEKTLDWDPVKMDFAAGSQGTPEMLARRIPRAPWRVYE